MSKIQSGLILIVVGIVINILGRPIIAATRSGNNVILATLMAVWMVASTVIVLFGLFRLIVGLVKRNGSANPE